MTVLVAGATGTTGSAVVRGLRSEGIPVRAMTRSLASAQRLRDAGVAAVVADLGDEASLARAVDGVDAVYVATSASDALAEQEGALARAAAQAGVRQLVKLSVIGAAGDSPLTFARLHHAAEQAVLDAGVRCTMVRPNGFMQNTLAWAGQLAGGAVYSPFPDARWSIVDVRDVAAVAVRALADPDTHAGEVYTCTGPEASSPREQVATLAELSGHAVEVVEVSVGEARQAMLDAGIPAWSVERLAELLAWYADGHAAGVSPEVPRVTGRPARTYREFARDHEAALAPTSARPS